MMPRPLKGYWVDRSSIGFADLMFPCARSTCKGVKNFSAHESCWGAAGYEETSGRCVPDRLLCNKGSTGYLCGSCIDGFTFSSAQAKCVKCGSSNSTLPLILAAVLVVVAVVAVALYVNGFKPPPVVARMAVFQSLGKLDKGTLKVCFVV